MAANGRSNVHDDAYMSDTYAGAGPLGRNTGVSSTYLVPGTECGSIAFDGAGRIVSVCVGLTPSAVIGTSSNVNLVLMDQRSLQIDAAFALPPRQVSPSPFNDFSAGGYFYLDNLDRAVVGTTTRHIFVIAEIENSFAVDPASGGGVYIVSETAMYRFHASATGSPAVTWQRFYDRTNVQKPGQVDQGSGTTPTLMGSTFVSITDNADPMDIVVYQRDTGAVVCKQPVFDTAAFTLPPGSPSMYASDTENSLIGTATQMIVENNYGYSGPGATSGGGVTYPGMERVDVNPRGGCMVRWLSMVRAPSVVAKLSLATGLVYTYTKPPDCCSPTPNPPSGADPWYLTAISFRSGATVFSRLAGVGLGYNNNYAPVSLAPDGAAYVGVLGGLVEFRDGS